MSSKKIQYVFGRLHFSGYEDYKQKEDRLWTCLNGSAIYTYGDFRYTFVNVAKHSQMDHNFVMGKIAKFNPEGIIKQMASGDGQNYEVNRNIKDLFVSDAYFILHIKTGIIAFSIVKNRFTETQFKDVFVNLLLLNGNIILSSLELEMIQSETNFFDKVRKLVKIDKVTIKLHPTNPSNRDLYDEIDKRLKKLNVTKKTEVYESDSDSGLVVHEGEIHSGAVMAVDGYGEADFSGLDASGTRHNVKSSEEPIKVEIKIDPLGDPQKIIAATILAQFESIWKRIQNG